MIVVGRSGSCRSFCGRTRRRTSSCAAARSGASLTLAETPPQWWLRSPRTEAQNADRSLVSVSSAKRGAAVQVDFHTYFGAEPEPEPEASDDAPRLKPPPSRGLLQGARIGVDETVIPTLPCTCH
jgi:hypothetical protein